MESRRDEFLVEMYRQMFNDINRHIMVIWQSIGLLIGAFAIFALVAQKVISPDIATSIIVLLVCWYFAHLIESSYWYNRNLVIIANIERQFLVKEDLRDIQYYFGKHRANKMIKHLQIQAALGWGLLFVVLIYHFSTRVWPGLSLPKGDFQILRALPYFFVLLSAICICYLIHDRNKAYTAFLNESPGKAVDTTDVNYNGAGHAVKDS